MTNSTMTEEDLRKRLDDFFKNRTELIQLLNEYAKELDEVHKNVKITKVVTGSTGIAGTILCITGLALAIPTAGLSMFLTIGGGAHLGSDITERVITKFRLDRLDELCKADEANILKIQNFLQEENEKLQKTINEQTVREMATSIYTEIAGLGNLLCSVVRVTQATTLTVNTIKIFGAASAVLSLATLPIQIIDLAANNHALHHKQGSPTSEKLRNLAELLNAQVANIRKFIEDRQRL